MQQAVFDSSSLLWGWLVYHARGPLGPGALWQLCLLPLLFGVVLFACLPDGQGRRWRDCIFLSLVLLLILLGVLPSLSKDYLQVDEASFVADARKLAFDPVFYRSIDGGTTGPLNIYVLTVPAWFGAPITYLSARLTGAFLMFGLIVCLYICCASFLGKRTGRLAILPLLGVVALNTHYDFLHYSSERVAVFLTGLSLVLLSRQYFGTGRYLKLTLFGVGAITAAMCFSKIQSAPIALTVALAALLHAWLSRRGGLPGAVCLVFGAAAVPVAFCTLFLYYGVFREFWESYIAWNLAYSDLSGLSLPTKMYLTVRWFFGESEFSWYHVGFALGGLMVLLERRRRLESVLPDSARMHQGVARPNFQSRDEMFGKLAPPAFLLALVAASLYAVAKPGNPFEHYLQFLMAPWTLCLALAISWARKTDMPAAAKRVLVLLAFVLPPILRISTEGPASYTYVPQYDPDSSALIRLAKAYASEGEFLVLWGWRSELYVKTNMLPGTRFENSGMQLESTPQRAFFQGQYLRDFVAANPPLFIDAVGPAKVSPPGAHGTRRYQNRSFSGHETFPELARIIQEKYTLIADVENVRLYLRNDRWKCCPRLS